MESFPQPDRMLFVFKKMFFSLLICCLFIHQKGLSQDVTGKKDIIIRYEKQDNSAILTCTVKDIGSRKVIWTKLSEPYPLAVGNTRFTPNRKFSVKVQDNVSVLTIKSVQLKDAGEYQCRLTGQVFVADFITLTIKGGPDSVYLLSTNTTVLGEIGSTVLLPCEVQNLNFETVLWKTPHNEIVSLRKKLYMDDSRYRVVHDTGPQWSLEIKNVRVTDFGLFTCMVNTDPVLTRSVLLKNSGPLRSSPMLIMGSSFRKRVTEDEGQTVTLTCNFRASPAANVTWYRKKAGQEKREKIGGGNELRLDKVSVEQSGDYICIGENGVNPSGKGKTKLTVIGAPTPAAVIETTTFIPNAPIAPMMYHEKKRTPGNLGSDVRIKCTSVGFPRPEIAWKRHGQRLSETYKHAIQNQLEGRHAIHSVLLVRSLQPSELGEYVCEAWNPIGFQTISLEIYKA